MQLCIEVLIHNYYSFYVEPEPTFIFMFIIIIRGR